MGNNNIHKQKKRLLTVIYDTGITQKKKKTQIENILYQKKEYYNI